MKRRRKIWIIVASIVGATVAVLCGIMAHQAKHPALRLRIVEQTGEDGKQLVTFKIAGSQMKRFHITDAYFLIGTAQDSQASTHYILPGDFPSDLCRQFAVYAPPNAPVWRLQIGGIIYPQSALARLSDMPKAWRAVKKTGQLAFGAIPIAWSITADGPYQWIESDCITNTVSTIATDSTQDNL